MIQGHEQQPGGGDDDHGDDGDECGDDVGSHNLSDHDHHWFDHHPFHDAVASVAQSVNGAAW